MRLLRNPILVGVAVGCGIRIRAGGGSGVVGRCLAWLVTLLACGIASGEVSLAVRGGTIHTMAGPPISDGVILIENGKIARVGSASEVAIPAGVRTIEAKVVVPGLIDAHTIVGLQGYENEPRENDVLDRTGPFQPELRAVDAFNCQERLLEWVRGFGVTTIHTGPAPQALSGGQTAVFKTFGQTVEDCLLKPDAMVSITLGPSGLVRETPSAASAAPAGKSPGTRAKQMAMLRQELIRAGEYEARRSRAAATTAPSADDAEGKSTARDLRLEVLVEVLKKRKPLLITAQRSQDILLALKLKEEFDLKIVLDLAEESYLLLDQIKAAGVPVIIHPTMKRAFEDSENLSMETAAKLKAAGIPFAFQSGYESYVPKTRVVLFEAAVAAANGLKFEDALAALTIVPAQILGIAERVGSIEVGKDADLALFDGDPFEYTTHCVATLIDGRIVHDAPR
ncbi:MAG: amidohydrolase family protein [Phycisphaerales bacterium]|nr:amidohydrolase family protein [Phycisphaerales bacterium]